MGSSFNDFRDAMGMDTGRCTRNSIVDARAPLYYGRFAINDYHAQRRMLSTSEVFTYSSNIGAALMARSLGITAHQAFLRKMGQLDQLKTELPESRKPMVPSHWAEVNTVTISFGHGLSVAPLQ